MLEDRVSPNDRPNRVSIGASLAPAVRPRASTGARTGTRRWTLLLGGWQVSGTYQYQSGFPITWGNLYFDPRAAIPTQLKSNIGQKVNGGDRRARRAGVGHVVLLLPRRGRADQRRGRPREAARRHADPAGQQRPVLPVDAARACGTTPCTCWTSGCTRTSSCRTGMKLQFRFECDQRPELHGAVGPGHRIRATRRSASSRRTATTRATCKSGSAGRSRHATGRLARRSLGGSAAFLGGFRGVREVSADTCDVPLRRPVGRRWRRRSAGRDGTRLHPRPDAVVAADGSGQSRTVQDAINAAPQTTQRDEALGHLRQGRRVSRTGLRAAREAIRVARRRGSGADDHLVPRSHAGCPARTACPWARFARRRSGSTPTISAPRISRLKTPSGPVGQALAVRRGRRPCACSGTAASSGWQDTLFAQSRPPFHRRFADHRARGFHLRRRAPAYFDRCDLHVWGNGYLTAASTPVDQPFGFVFADGAITGEPDARTYLGRPWRDFAQTVFLRTAMSDVVRPEGWHNWDRPEREKTARYAEAASTRTRQRRDRAWRGRSTFGSADARAITIDSVLGGADHWRPQDVPAHPSGGPARGLPRPLPPGAAGRRGRRKSAHR